MGIRPRPGTNIQPCPLRTKFVRQLSGKADRPSTPHRINPHRNQSHHIIKRHSRVAPSQRQHIVRAPHDLQRGLTRPTHRPSPLNLPPEIRLRPLSHAARIRLFPGMARHARLSRAGSRGISINRCRLSTSCLGRSRNHGTFGNRGRRLRHTIQPDAPFAGLLRGRSPAGPSDRAGTGAVRSEPHPPRITPATPRHQRDNITPHLARHPRRLPRRHHRSTRILTRHQHHRSTHIRRPAKHKPHNPTVGHHLRRHRHPRRIRWHPYRPRTEPRTTRTHHPGRLRRRCPLARTIAQASHIRIPRKRIRPGKRSRNSRAIPHRPVSRHYGFAAGTRNRPSHRMTHPRSHDIRGLTGHLSGAVRRILRGRVARLELRLHHSHIVYGLLAVHLGGFGGMIVVAVRRIGRGIPHRGTAVRTQ